MRNDINTYPFPDQLRAPVVRIFPWGLTTLSAVIAGDTTNGRDVTGWLGEGGMTSKGASLKFSATDDFMAQPPKPNDIVAVYDAGGILHVGIIINITSYLYSREKGRELTVTTGQRDSTGLWKTTTMVTRMFPKGIEFTEMAKTVMINMGLSDNEYVLPPANQTLTHFNAQFAEQTAWQDLTDIYFAVGRVPMCDALNRIGTFDKNVNRPADIEISQDRLVEISGNKVAPSVSSVLISWLSPDLKKVYEQIRVLNTAQITAGFFKLEQKTTVYFSQDLAQRAENTYMRIKQSINSGLIPCGSEKWTQLDPYSGEIKTEQYGFVQGLATASVAAILASSHIGDEVTAVVEGWTVPVGTAVATAGQVGVMLAMMSLGTGIYEIWGMPYDMVHMLERTEAYASDLPSWTYNRIELRNDLVPSEDSAQSLAVNELLYQNAKASTWQATIHDDPRLEVGDIVQFTNGWKFFVTDYNRSITRGSPTLLTLSGFRVG